MWADVLEEGDELDVGHVGEEGGSDDLRYAAAAAAASLDTTLSPRYSNLNSCNRTVIEP